MTSKEYKTNREIIIDYALGYITKIQALQIAHLNGLRFAYIELCKLQGDLEEVMLGE